MRGKGSAWRFWPSAPDGAPPVVFGVALVVALVTALTEPYAVTGVAGLLTGITVAAGPVAVAVLSRPARWRLVRPLPIAAGVCTLLLLAMGTVRDAGWLYALCLLTALGLASYGLVAGRRWSSVFLAGFAAPIGLIRGIPWLFRGLRLSRTAGGPGRQRPATATPDGSSPGEPASGVAAETSPPGGPAPASGVAAGTPPPGGQALARGAAAARLLAVVVGTGLLLLIFGALFASADPAFSSMLSRMIPELSPELIGRSFVGLVVAGFTLGACVIARTPPRIDRLGTTRPRRVRRIEWLVPMVPLVALFAAFVAVQITVLFGGHEHVLRTAGLTYADYARRGFGELVMVTLLTLAVLAAVARWAPRATAPDRALLRLVPGALCLLILVIVASALYRMHLYQEAYGFTRLRLVVDAFELWLGVVFVMILVAGARLRGSWLPRATVGTGVAALLVLGAMNPDAFIAERNAARYADSKKIDVGYLRELSADAVPALDRLPEPQRSCALSVIEVELREPEEWYTYNPARERARELLKRHPVRRDVTCPERYTYMD
ncbi:MAG: DUF4153 domain-containing protein [Micromonosporaceae bacterium]